MRRRSGFTLIELLVVITILLVLATLVFAVFRTGSGSDRMRSAARLAQSAFMGAKDRALHAKDLRGVRLVRDQNGPKAANGIPTLATGFVYLQPIPNLVYPQGSFSLERLDMQPDNIADNPDIVILNGNGGGVDWDTKSIFFLNPGRIRIPAGTGQWYTFSWSTSGPYALGPNNEYLQLSAPFANGPGNPFNNVTAFPRTSSFSSCEIELPAEVMPFHQPISLPSATVIDLQFSSPNVQALAGMNLAVNAANPPIAPNIDFMFSSRGMISGPIGAQGPLHFLIRDVQDAMAGVNPFAVGSPNSTNPDLSKGDRLIVTLFPQTGLVQTFPVDPTDNVQNTGPNAGQTPGDGLADNPFNFAQQGKSAGQ